MSGGPTRASEDSPPDSRLPADAGPAVTDPAELEERLRAKLGEVLPEEERQKALSAVHEIVATASFQGSLPPPVVLERYDRIAPGAAERIIAMAEREQAHRHAWEQRALSADRWYATTGLLAGWTTAVALATGATIAGVFGDRRVGVALAAASATGMVGKLVQGRSDATEEPAKPPSEPTPRQPRESGGRAKRW